MPSSERAEPAGTSDFAELSDFFGKNQADGALQACIFDWDGTLRPGFMLVDWLKFLSAHFHVSDLFYRALDELILRYRRDGLKYEVFADKAARMYTRALAGLDPAAVNEASNIFVQEDKQYLCDYSIDLINLARENRYLIIVLSGSPLVPLLSYARLLSIDLVFGIEAKLAASGKYSSRLVRNYAQVSNKRLVVDQLLSEGIGIGLAFGDTDADAPLLDAATHPFRIQPSRVARHSGYCDVTSDNILSVVRRVVRGRENGVASSHRRDGI